MSDSIIDDELRRKTYHKLGEALEQLGRWEEAVGAYQRSIELNGNSSFSYESLGNLLAEKGQFDLAIGMYRTAIRLNPSFHGFHYHLAQAQIGKNDYQNAIAELLSCIDKNFQHYPSYDLIGDLLIQQGQEAQLIQLYRQGLLAMRHNYTDYKKFIQKISDLGLDEEKIFNQSFLKDLQVISDFWEPHQSVGKRDEWILIELHACNAFGVGVTGWNLLAAKCLQKLYGYRIAAFVAWGYDHQIKQLLISFGVEKLIIGNADYGLTDHQKYQLEKFSQDANSENFKYLLKDFKCDDLHIGDLVYDLLIRQAAMSTPILDQRVMAGLGSQCLAYNFWKNFLDSCKVKFLITTHATVYIQGLISRLVATAKGIVLDGGGPCISRYETVDELYDGQFSISEQLFLYFWNHHRHESAAIGRKLVENTTGIKLSDASLLYETKAYKDKKVYTHLEFCEQLNLDPSLPIVIVASHVFNDSPHYYRHRLFVDYYEAFVETLKICSQIDSVNWIVKEHPEVGNISMGFNVDKTAKELVNNEYSSYQHIKLAPDDLSNLSLIDFCHAVITVSGTIAHELACFGIPSILAGSSSYSECGFTNNPQSVDEYKSLLDYIHKQDKLSPEKIEKAYVAYAILYHYMRPAGKGNLDLGWGEPWAVAESLANKIKSNEIGTVEEDTFFKNFMTQILLKKKDSLRFDELLD
ncbi:tetratricopeptide repeat protein [Kamptonema animale CS-326]|jgi:tetratricopeptide (TPR) repeat protein|uniref:tetratricopeptide repeat protein n=1 Tax=Kamptonema animale TaxID=92934 RepID=UPI002330AFA4|nr:tetratricopeptide repeat protein [Kamptonema animale]MDB9512774.1 tetratricopeptide repeat protein [Kamptonema animale CS-326]